MSEDVQEILFGVRVVVIAWWSASRMRGSRQLGAKGVAAGQSGVQTGSGRPGIQEGVVGEDQQAGTGHQLFSYIK